MLLCVCVFQTLVVFMRFWNISYAFVLGHDIDSVCVSVSVF